MNRLAGSALAGLLLVASLGGCASTDVPNFGGPWAAEFAQAYAATDNQWVRGAVEDGTISDQEYSEMVERLRSCLADVGITMTVVDNSYRWDIPDGSTAREANDHFDACSHSVGETYIGWLYFGVRRNPDHRDESALIATCLVQKSAVPEGYDAKDYERDSEKQTFPFTDPETGKSQLVACSEDPLGLLK